MFDPNVLLSGLLQGGMRGPAMGRIEHAMGQPGFGGQGFGGSGGGSGGVLGQLGGLLGGGSRGGGTLGQLAGLAGGRGGGTGGGLGGLAGLAGAVLGGRGMAGMSTGLGGGGRGVAGAGGLALLGMLAMRALSASGQTRASGHAPGLAESPADTAEPPQPPEQAISETTAQLLVRAMIAAAKADGEIDPTERQRITAKVEEHGAQQEEIEFLRRELERPLDATAIAAEARDPVVAGQVYAASLLAIQVDTQRERDYLRDLAGKLSLQPATVTQLHQMLGAPAP